MLKVESKSRCPICGLGDLKLDSPASHRRNYLQKWCTKCESWVIPEVWNWKQTEFKIEA